MPPNGSRSGHSGSCWRSGRWCALRVTTGDEPLTIRSVSLEENRYPLEGEDAFACDDARIPGIRKIALLPQELTPASGLLTPSLKLKRREVNEAFKGLIEGLYRPGC